MNRIRRNSVVIPIVLATLSLGVAQGSQLSCTGDREFQGQPQALTTTVSQRYFMLRGCSGALTLYTKTKDPLYLEGQYNRITLRLAGLIAVCTEEDGSIYNDRILRITQFKIAKKVESQVIEFFDQNEQLMMIMVYEPIQTVMHIPQITLQGQYKLFLPPIIFHFPSPGRIVIDACMSVSGFYTLSSDGTIDFQNVQKAGQCQSDYHDYVVEAVKNSTSLSLTNEAECEFSLIRNQNQLEIVVAPVPLPEDVVTLAGNYYLYLVGSALPPINVTVTDDEFEFTACSKNNFTYVTTDLRNIQFSGYYTASGSCPVNNDREYLYSFQRVDRLQYDNETGKLRLFGGSSDIPIFTTDRQEYQEMRPIPFLTGNYSFTIPGSVVQSMKVTFTEDSNQFIRFVIHGCNPAQLTWTKRENNRVYYSGIRVVKVLWCDPDNDLDFTSRIEQTVRLEYDQDTSQLKMINALNNVALVGKIYEEPTETSSGSSLRGQHSFSFPGSTLDPIQVMVLRDNDKFIMLRFMECNQWNITLNKGILNLVSYSRAVRSTTLNMCSQDRDNEYIEKFKQVSGMVYNSVTKETRIENELRQLIALGTQFTENSLVGEYTLYLPGTNLSEIKLMVTKDRFYAQKCNMNHFAYAIEGVNRITFSGYTLDYQRFCEPDNDAQYGSKFIQVQKFSFDPQTRELQLMSSSGDVIYTTQRPPQVSLPSIGSSLGNFNFTFPGFDLDQIQIAVTEDGRYILFMLKGCNVYNLTFIRSDLTSVSYLGIASQLIKKTCASDKDTQYIELIKRVKEIMIDPSTEDVIGKDENRDTVLTSEQEEAQLSLAGQYTLYLVGSNFQPITVTATKDLFIVRGCNTFNFGYTATIPNAIVFSNLPASTTLISCEDDHDAQHRQKFGQVRSFEFNQDTNLLRLYDSNSQLIYSTVQQDYTVARPRPLFNGNYNLTFVNPNLDSVEVTASEDDQFLRFVLKACNVHTLTYSKNSQDSVLYVSINSERTKQCEPDNDALSIEILKQLVTLTFNRDRAQTSLVSSNRVIVATIRQLDETGQQEGQSLGDFNLTNPATGSGPVSITVTDHGSYIRIVLKGCNTFNLKFLKRDLQHISFSKLVADLAKNSCANDNDNEFLNVIKQVTNITVDSATGDIILSNSNGDTILTNRPSLAGQYTLYLVRSNLQPITVTATKDRFSVRGCNTFNLGYTATIPNVIVFSNLPASTTLMSCEDDHDAQHRQKFGQVRSFEFNQDTNFLRLYDSNSQLTYSTVQQDYTVAIPRPLFNGNYNLTFVNPNLDSVEVTASEDDQFLRFVLKACNVHTLTYSKNSQDSVLYVSINSERTKQCEPDNDALSIEILKQLVTLTFNRDRAQTSLVSSNRVIVATIRQLDETGQQEGQSLGDFNLTNPATGSGPVSITVTDHGSYIRIVLKGCNTFNLKFLKRDLQHISFSKLVADLAKNSCANDNDNEFLNVIKQVTNITVDSATGDIILSNSNGDTILTNRPSLAGQYTLYLVRSNLQPITVTATANLLSFQGCTNPYLRYTASSSSLIAFTNFTSSQNQCSVTYDSEYVQKFGEIVRFQFDRNTNMLRFYGQGSQLIYSTVQQDYLDTKPKPVLAREYKLYPVDSNLQPLTVTVTDDEFIFTGCNINNFDYTMTQSDSISFSSFSSTLKSCEIDQDNEYINKFKQVSNYQLRPDLLKLYSRNSTMIYSTDPEDYLQSTPQYQNHNNYIFDFPGSNLNPIEVRVTENNQQVIFSFQNCNWFQLAFHKQNYPRVVFDSLSSVILQTCTPNRDNDYILEFDKILKQNYKSDTMSLKLQNSAEYIFIKNQDGTHSIMKPKLIGKFHLYRPNLYLDSVTVTAKQNSDFYHFTFQGCNSFTVILAKINSNRVQFDRTNSLSTTYRCLIDNDQDYIALFKQIAWIYFTPNSQELSLNNEAGDIIFSTDKSVQPFLAGQFTFYDSFEYFLSATVTETESQIKFVFTGCNTPTITYEKRDMLRVIHLTVETPNNGKQCYGFDERYKGKFRQVVRITASLDGQQINLYDTRGAVVLTTKQPGKNRR